ncbi:ankyrin repeat domain-containing protein [Cohnella silvisoli]|uniref:Ankyrin repeat domain-containing protein n=1 Tax=Cohnella silvisoli TaxID=2873699 RepID=A0ABV1KZI3_9BACL|nr:ankyrin repeat domain-containing protein [Cohnella silvisoli]MCD9024442.1 ankyrin repeat domain-containing protein [Cohnella silvisoli]
MTLESRKPLAAIEPELVKQFVSSAHADLHKVKELLERGPGLLHASMNWGGGDWETGLGAAAHVGRRDIAEYLLSRGARLDLFAAAMLGQLELVKLIIGQFPDMAHATGPHGIPLIRHAAMGGEEARLVFEFLEQLHWDK